MNGQTKHCKIKWLLQDMFYTMIEKQTIVTIIQEITENESLQRLYDGLITIGYEMSDEELAMMDGTHELYTTEDE